LALGRPRTGRRGIHDAVVSAAAGGIGEDEAAAVGGGVVRHDADAGSGKERGKLPELCTLHRRKEQVDLFQMSAPVVAGDTTGVEAQELGGGKVREVVPEILLRAAVILGNLPAEGRSGRRGVRVARRRDDIARKRVVRAILFYKLADEGIEVVPLRDPDGHRPSGVIAAHNLEPLAEPKRELIHISRRREQSVDQLVAFGGRRVGGEGFHLLEGGQASGQIEIDPPHKLRIGGERRRVYAVAHHLFKDPIVDDVPGGRSRDRDANRVQGSAPGEFAMEIEGPFGFDTYRRGVCGAPGVLRRGRRDSQKDAQKGMPTAGSEARAANRHEEDATTKSKWDRKIQVYWSALTGSPWTFPRKLPDAID